MKSFPPREGGTVWVLEDSALEAEMARRALAPDNRVELFADGSLVLERIANVGLPDALVLDWQLPGMSGVDLCRFLRSSHDEMVLPILMLTGYGQKEDIVEALDAGANDYVTKPYDVAELVARVATLVRTSGLRKQQIRKTRQLALAADVGAALMREKTLGEIAQHCVSAVVTHAEVSGCAFYLRRGDRLEPIAVAGVNAQLSPEQLHAIAFRDSASMTSLAPPDLVHGAPFDDRARASCAAFPLVLADGIAGALVVVGRASILADAKDALAHVGDLLKVGVARARSDEERALLLERERSARSDAETANRSKDEFLAMVSHELRTPLNAIAGWASVLRSDATDPVRLARGLETIERNARLQAQLIDDLLDVSRIISGKLHLQMGRVDMGSVAEMALESIRFAAAAKSVTLDVRLAERTSVTGDPQRLQQIVWNLLSNAVKFTPSGGTVRLELTCEHDNAEIRVTDSGQGISPDFLPFVFERFRQADASTVRGTGGLGLGLAIVRQLVELHRGTVSAASEGPGRGATFIVRLPMERHTPHEMDLRHLGGAKFECPPEIRDLRVLVVDDEEDARELLKTLLQMCGVEVRVASNAGQALEMLMARPPDVLISDVAMPDEDGLALIRRVRTLGREQGGRVPAVALTAHARAEDRAKALRAGFTHYVGKPVDATELLAVLTTLAQHR